MYNARLWQKRIHQQTVKILKKLKDRKRLLEDSNRKAAVSKRHKKGKRTARENINDLCDKGSFQEIGSLIVCGTKRTQIR